jgi:hypothetical protein
MGDVRETLSPEYSENGKDNVVALKLHHFITEFCFEYRT